jgi:sarcosine oxidase, subunit gamma
MLSRVGFEPVARSLISAKAPVRGVASLDQVDQFGAINLRLPDATLPAKATKEYGLLLPASPNTFTQQGDVTVLWLGPDEWMVHAPLKKTHDLKQGLEAELGGRHAAVTDVSDNSVAMELGGQSARRILEKGCPLDLHPRAFGAGQCAQSHFLQAVILLAQIESDRFLLRVRRSMSEYLWDALADAILKEGRN